MGIPVYFRTLIDDYKNICNSNIDVCDYLFFDLNCLIHPVCRGETDETVMYEKLVDRIHLIVNMVKPQKYVVIAIDGPCPKPKMVQQRQRRFKSANESKPWDTNKITPGTDFMNCLENYLLKHLVFNVNFVFSSSNEAGEGEHKIFYYIKQNKTTNNVVYGLDADLIMLSLINDQQIYLLRERTEYNIENIDSEYIYLNISNLKCQIIDKIKPKNYKLDDKTLLVDYVFICFFLGNDFIQHTPSINTRYDGLNILLTTYNKLNDLYDGRFNLIDHQNSDLIDISNLRTFIHELSLCENENLKTILKIRDNQERKYRKLYERNKTDYENHMPVIDRKREREIFSDLSKWIPEYYMETVFHTRYSPVYFDRLNREISKICDGYLQSLYWTIHYYLRGCISWRWSYPYDVAPSFKDLSEHIETVDKIRIKNKDIPYTPQEQLEIVLPQKSHYLLKIKPELNYMYPISAKTCSILKRYEWECHPILPPI